MQYNFSVTGFQLKLGVSKFGFEFTSTFRGGS